MKLADLLSGIQTIEVSGNVDVEVNGIAYDSRNAESGSLFTAIEGKRADGHDFIPQAIANGAAVIVSERSAPTDTAVGWIRVASAREAMAELAARFYRYPARRLCLVGVTGTNGKTTTAYLLESVFRAAGRSVVLLGTIAQRGPGFDQPASLTTPEAPDLERRFRDAVEHGATDAVMEVSSHAIAMKRVWGLDFDVAVFTNLSGEHLDFHGEMETYFETKRQLFTGFGTRPPRLAVVNVDDSYGQRLRNCGNEGVLTFSLNAGADVYPEEVSADWSGIRARFFTPGGSLEVTSPLIGRPNLSNIAAAVAVGTGLSVGHDAIARGVRDLRGVPGRFERISRGQAFEVIVDYAHTDDGLMKVLVAAADMTPGRLIVVFGAGGERDTSKRRRMGQIAARHSDIQILTSDNPRGESPERITGMVREGLDEESGKYSTIQDRRDAIREAIRQAREGDTIVIAGKGHEDYQIVGDERLPFDDRVVAAELLDELEAGPSR